MKKTVIYIFLLIISISVVLLVNNENLYNNNQDIELNIDSTKIEKLEFKYSDKKLIFEKKDEFWYLTYPENFRVEPTIFNTFLSELENLQFFNVVTKNKEKHHKFGLSEKDGITISIFQKQKPTTSIILGKSSPEGTQNYYRFTNSNEVYLGTFTPSIHAVIDIETIRSDIIFYSENNDIKQLYIFDEKSKKELTFIKNEMTGWNINNEELNSQKEIELAIELCLNMRHQGVLKEVDNSKEKLNIRCINNRNIEQNFTIISYNGEYIVKNNNKYYKINEYIFNTFYNLLSL